MAAEIVCSSPIAAKRGALLEPLTQPNAMQQFANASSFASRKNAITKLTRVLGDDLAKVHYFIIVQEDGRFTPVVNVHGTALACAGAAIAQAGIAVIG